MEMQFSQQNKQLCTSKPAPLQFYIALLKILGADEPDCLLFVHFTHHLCLTQTSVNNNAGTTLQRFENLPQSPWEHLITIPFLMTFFLSENRHNVLPLSPLCSGLNNWSLQMTTAWFQGMWIKSGHSKALMALQLCRLE